MNFTFGTRLKHAVNAFMNRDPTNRYMNVGPGSSYRPDRYNTAPNNDKTIITAVQNRIAIDVASITINHCKTDDDDRFKEVIKSPLNRCLNLESNIDQTGRAFIQDTVMSMLNSGVVAMVPIDTDVSDDKKSVDILSLRTGQILEWYPQHVKVRLYNENKGHREDIILPKRSVGIVENPLYMVMNEYNSNMQRLLRKLYILDVIDEQSGAGKLDMIIQLPYVIKTPARREEAQKRIKEIEEQLSGTKYGVAYTDGTEKVVQLNRSLDNNLMKQVEYLTNMMFSQLGITEAILNGTATDQEITNYYTRTIEPIISAIVDEMKRKFLTEDARKNGESVMYFRNPFKLVPVNVIADISDKFTRNEIVSSNEIRQSMGMKPSDDPKADKLINSNLNQPESVLNDVQSKENINENQVIDENAYQSVMDKHLSDFDI